MDQKFIFFVKNASFKLQITVSSISYGIYSVFQETVTVAVVREAKESAMERQRTFVSLMKTTAEEEELRGMVREDLHC